MSGDLDDLVVFGDERIEDGVLLPKATANKKPSEKKPPKPEGPICRVVVHEIEDEECFDVEVAARQIALYLESNDSSETGAATGKGLGGFPVREYELALDANLSHLRLLIHQGNSKPLFNQRLFLLPASAGLDAVELDRGAANSKTMYETATGITCNPEMDVHSYHTLRLILVHGNSDDGAKKGRRRAKMTDEEKSLEQAMMATLMETACLGWKDSSNAKKNKEPRRQERGFQGTFLQSSDPMNGSTSSDTEIVKVAEINEVGASRVLMANQNPPADDIKKIAGTHAEDEDSNPLLNPLDRSSRSSSSSDSDDVEVVAERNLGASSKDSLANRNCPAGVIPNGVPPSINTNPQQINMLLWGFVYGVDVWNFFNRSRTADQLLAHQLELSKRCRQRCRKCGHEYSTPKWRDFHKWLPSKEEWTGRPQDRSLVKSEKVADSCTVPVLDRVDGFPIPEGVTFPRRKKQRRN
ncbi:hypothetical protein THAOC_04954 [Thalassiosira oceanica]|uniref:Uncharacterized protein n=1 Tax=Thalassiosira oceanica TaxID=159749 RepID=K0TND5_THAOC|nr:hypothetical protein THAOC_04954 [Thalassiosira oceanica]|eukprot:EJK73427.1 hypothetical protein THAOC_04954 [Thalassiosira oceanica]